jgi:hypothetical protein
LFALVRVVVQQEILVVETEALVQVVDWVI